MSLGGYSEPSPAVEDLDRSGIKVSTFALLSIWAFILLLSPIYVFPSGIPQPSDWLCLLLFSLLLIFGRIGFDPVSGVFLKRIAMFVFYTCIVNLVWTLLIRGLQNRGGSFPQELLLASAYYMFNLLVAASVGAMNFRMGAKFVHCTMVTIIISSVFQAVVAWQTMGQNEEGVRTTAFFENPNQLGYFAVLNASLLVVLARSAYASRWIVSLLPISIAALIYLAIVSSSRAGLVGIGFACLVHFGTTYKRLILFSILAIGAFFSGYLPAVSETLIERSIEKNQSFVEELAYRGYDRMWNHPEYLLLGAGEGEYERFQSSIQIELHSTPGSMLFSYGIVGAGLFAFAVFALVRAQGIVALVLLAPAFMYGLSHQGLRQSELWVLMVLVGAIASQSVHSQGDSGFVDEEEGPVFDEGRAEHV